MDQLANQDVQVEQVSQIIHLCVQIFSALGFTGAASAETGTGRQIVFENQQLTEVSAAQLTVIDTTLPVQKHTRTYNYQYDTFPGSSSAVVLQDRAVKTLKIQLVEGQNYHQLQLQLYFVQPLNYASEDQIYRVRAEKTPTGVKIKTGYHWLNPQLHLSTPAVIELLTQLAN